MRKTSSNLIITMLVAFLLPCLLSLSSSAVYAQRWSVSTNVAEWANLATINAEMGLAVDQNWSLHLSGRYNPYTFRKGDPDKQFQERQATAQFEVRGWPWHVYSGWWIAGGLQYSRYNWGGLFNKRKSEEGDAIGGTLAFGYTLMINSYFNIEFGLGVWGGKKWYTEYSCPLCGREVGKGSKGFIAPNEAIINLVYVF